MRPSRQSIKERLEGLPVVREHTHDAKGLVLYFPRTGLVMVPYAQVRSGWNCVVVIGNETYPRGGYDLFVSDEEIRRAPEHGV
ncbi:MAG: hypothetical protein ACYCR4_05885 [Acidimicrobiales bacterium]